MTSPGEEEEEEGQGRSAAPGDGGPGAAGPAQSHRRPRCRGHRPRPPLCPAPGCGPCSPRGSRRSRRRYQIRPLFRSPRPAAAARGSPGSARPLPLQVPVSPRSRQRRREPHPPRDVIANETGPGWRSNTGQGARPAPAAHRPGAPGEGTGRRARPRQRGDPGHGAGVSVPLPVPSTRHSGAKGHRVRSHRRHSPVCHQRRARKRKDEREERGQGLAGSPAGLGVAEPRGTVSPPHPRPAPGCEGTETERVCHPRVGKPRGRGACPAHGVGSCKKPPENRQQVLGGWSPPSLSPGSRVTRARPDPVSGRGS